MRRTSFLSWRSTPALLATAPFLAALPKVRNIGISAHIDSGKTTVTERILFYTGRINKMHEVKGSGDVGATMDSMELEKERGITIRSAATFARWGDTSINLIDTPGHVDFTIEVERALRVLDGAVLLMCAVGGVQSQTLTVDRQMKRYGVPRICFINKMDRDGANPQRALKMAHDRLNINAAFIQLNMGTAQDFEGVIDVITNEAVYFDGKHGEKIRREKVPEYMVEETETARKELIARLAEVDSKMEEFFLMEEEPSVEEIHDAIRRATIANTFVPVMVGTAYRNKGVQLLLDAVTRYLPHPGERKNTGYEQIPAKDEDGNKYLKKGDQVELACDDEKPLVAMVFKLEETAKTGLSNYIRVYQGRLKKSDIITNVRTGKQTKGVKLVRMHADSMEPVDEVKCGEICAIAGDFGATSGDTIMRATANQGRSVSCEDMYIPPRVISSSIKFERQSEENMGKERFQHFMREDPTFIFSRNAETGEYIIEGMGELHLDIYVERLKREHGIKCTQGKPTVNYREIIQKKAEFDFVYKRQSGGQGQYAHVKGYIEPLPINMGSERGKKNTAVSKCLGAEIRENLQKSFIKTFQTKVFGKGVMMQAPVWGVNVVLTGGSIHEVDSNDMAFKNAAVDLWENFIRKCEPTLVEPYMSVEITVPAANMSDVAGEFTKRDGTVHETLIDGNEATIRGETALDTMFGFISSLRKLTKGQGDFSMEFKEYRPMNEYKAQQKIDERNQDLGRKTFTISE